MSTLVNTLDIPCSLAREYIPVYSLYRVLSSPFICSRCSWVNAICEAISSLLGHETHETIMQGEKSKRESSPWVKRKEKSPGLKNGMIQSRMLLATRARGITSRTVTNFFERLRDRKRNRCKQCKNPQFSTSAKRGGGLEHWFHSVGIRVGVRRCWSLLRKFKNFSSKFIQSKNGPVRLESLLQSMFFNFFIALKV